MHRIVIALAATNGLIAVIAGAFGSHALKSRLDTGELATFDVAVRYQMYHALALMAVAWVMSIRPTRTASAAAICMLVGIVLFSGSIYGLSLFKWRWLGPVTPIGGVSLIAGWVLLAIAGLQAR